MCKADNLFETLLINSTVVCSMQDKDRSKVSVELEHMLGLLLKQYPDRIITKHRMTRPIKWSWDTAKCAEILCVGFVFTHNDSLLSFCPMAVTELMFKTWLHPITSGQDSYLIHTSVQSSRQHMYTGNLGHGDGRFRHLHTGYYGTYLE